MIRAIRPAAVARDDASLITGWNIAPNVGYTVTISVTASAVVVILASADGSTLIGSGVALVGTDQPVTITPVTGQTISMVDADLGWHLLVTTAGTEGERTITMDPMVDLADEIHPIYTDDGMALARATAAINAGTCYVDDVSVICPLGLGAGIGAVVSAPVDGSGVVGQVESVTWSGTPDGSTAQAVIRRHTAIAPEVYTPPPAPPVLADDTAETDAATATSGNVLTNDDTGLTIVAVNGLSASVGVTVDGDNGGSFVIAADGSWTFDPDGDFAALAGSETADTSVTYHASDGTAEAMATLTITVTAAASAPDDPLWDNVVLCLNAAGVDNSTAIIDETGKIPSIVNGNTKIRTVLGYNSIYLDGSGDYVRFDADGTDFDFGSDSFCIEAWLYLNKIAGNLFTQRTAGTGSGILFGFHSNQVSMSLGNGSSWFYAPSNFNLGVGANTLFHIALIRDGNTIRVCLDGAQIHSGTTTGVVGPAGLPVNVGWDPGNSKIGYYPLSGHIKGLRITKGDPRYTGTSFTPDAAPFLT